MNLMELYIKIMADDQATSKIEDVAEKTNGLASKMGAGLATAGKIGGAAVTATASGVAMLAKKATDAYSSFEQLKGGVETLFGEASETVLENAEKAFATSGTSMNQYMETVTSFAASLIQATGRGEQTDLEELETALDNRLSATKESLEEEYDARKECYNDIYKDQQQANKDEYDELKRSLDAQYEERKAYWDAVLNGSDSKQAKEDQKKARDDELKNLKQANSDKLAAVKAANAEQLKSTKDTLKAEVEARKDYYEQLIEAAEGADAKKALRAQRDAEIKSMKESNTARETALKNSLDQEYKDLKASLDAQYNARKDYWADAIKTTSENATADKEALKAQKEAELKEIKEAQKAQLEAYKKGQAAELAALKSNNKKELKELENANKKSLKVTEQANKDRLKQTKALNEQSTKTAESLQEAARLADMALQDMSDNANKMGTAMGSIQNAYQGFAKANYTMLDNLKLGYGGTKAEMERLLEDAERLAGVKFDISSYADVVQAIHVIQQEMGITGTTAAEASATITGSMGALKASLENLFVSISSGDRIQESFKNLFDTAVAFGQNYFPRIEQSLESIDKLIPEAIPLIFEKVSEIVDKEVPKVVESATGILNKIVEVLSDKESINKLTNTATNTITTLATALAEATPDLMVGAARIITNVVGILADPEQIKKLLEAGGKIVSGLMEGIGESYNEISTSVSMAVSAMSAYLKAPENLQTIKTGAKKLLDDFLAFMTDEEAWKNIGSTAGDIVAGLISGLINAADGLLSAAGAIWEAFDGFLNGEDWDTTSDEIMNALGSGFVAFWGKIQPVLEELDQKMTNWFESRDWNEVGRKIMEKIIDGFLNRASDNQEKNFNDAAAEILDVVGRDKAGLVAGNLRRHDEMNWLENTMGRVSSEGLTDSSYYENGAYGEERSSGRGMTVNINAVAQTPQEIIADLRFAEVAGGIQ